jgi:pullulanase/glycogen debranching enzyme
LLFVNAGSEPLEFAFPDEQIAWHPLLDSAKADGRPDNDALHDQTVRAANVTVQGHTVMLFGTHKVHR